MFLNIVEWGIKNLFFHTGTVFGCIFHKGKGQMNIFESSIKRRIF
jgi:hypothetical protein